LPHVEDHLTLKPSDEFSAGGLSCGLLELPVRANASLPQCVFPMYHGLAKQVTKLFQQFQHLRWRALWKRQARHGGERCSDLLELQRAVVHKHDVLRTEVPRLQDFSNGAGFRSPPHAYRIEGTSRDIKIAAPQRRFYDGH